MRPGLHPLLPPGRPLLAVLLQGCHCLPGGRGSPWKPDLRGPALVARPLGHSWDHRGKDLLLHGGQPERRVLQHGPPALLRHLLGQLRGEPAPVQLPWAGARPQCLVSEQPLLAVDVHRAVGRRPDDLRREPVWDLWRRLAPPPRRLPRAGGGERGRPVRAPAPGRLAVPGAADRRAAELLRPAGELGGGRPAAPCARVPYHGAARGAPCRHTGTGRHTPLLLRRKALRDAWPRRSDACVDRPGAVRAAPDAAAARAQSRLPRDLLGWLISVLRRQLGQQCTLQPTTQEACSQRALAP
mmetsp:Transcript_99080/g.289046  ORF Transcript_99080/g.289046 Transcript_99080/m.289046 type:complete len:298 (-) Transcript_99080:283-1176(-)